MAEEQATDRRYLTQDFGSLTRGMEVKLLGIQGDKAVVAPTKDNAQHQIFTVPRSVLKQGEQDTYQTATREERAIQNFMEGHVTTERRSCGQAVKDAMGWTGKMGTAWGSREKYLPQRGYHHLSAIAPRSAPRGTLILIPPTPRNSAGHIGISVGNGEYISMTTIGDAPRGKVLVQRIPTNSEVWGRR